MYSWTDELISWTAKVLLLGDIGIDECTVEAVGLDGVNL